MRALQRLIHGFVFCLAFRPAGAALAWQPESSAKPDLVRIQQRIQAGDLRSARSGLEQALVRLPGDPRVFNLLGVVDAQEGNFAAAESNFRGPSKPPPILPRSI